MRYYHRTVERSSRYGVDAGAEHGHVLIGAVIRQLNTVAYQRVFKCETATQQERHEVVAPVMH